MLGLGGVTRFRVAAVLRDADELRGAALEVRLDERDEPCAREACAEVRARVGEELRLAMRARVKRSPDRSAHLKARVAIQVNKCAGSQLGLDHNRNNHGLATVSIGNPLADNPSHNLLQLACV